MYEAHGNTEKERINSIMSVSGGGDGREGCGIMLSWALGKNHVLGGQCGGEASWI